MKNRNVFQQFWLLIQITTFCYKSDVLSHDNLSAVSSAQIIEQNLTQNIIKDTIKAEKKEMHQDRILTNSRVNGTLRR